MYPLDLIINNINVTFSMLLPSMKCRQKGMVVILCVCVSVCLCVCNILGKLRTLVAPLNYWQTSNYTRIKNNKRLLLKPFGYKDITIFITHTVTVSRLEKPLGDIWTHQNITTPVSWLLHYIKANILHENYFLAPPTLSIF